MYHIVTGRYDIIHGVWGHVREELGISIKNYSLAGVRQEDSSVGALH